MKANINALVLCLLFLLSACEYQPRKIEETDMRQDSIAKQLKEIPFGVLKTIEIEGCEYLMFKQEIDANESMGFMAHKGNCKNPIHCAENIENE